MKIKENGCLERVGKGWRICDWKHLILWENDFLSEMNDFHRRWRIVTHGFLWKIQFFIENVGFGIENCKSLVENCGFLIEIPNFGRKRQNLSRKLLFLSGNKDFSAESLIFIEKSVKIKENRGKSRFGGGLDGHIWTRLDLWPGGMPAGCPNPLRMRIRICICNQNSAIGVLHHSSNTAGPARGWPYSARSVNILQF